MDRLTQQVEALAQTQEKTEVEIRTLTRTVKNLQKEVGGISNTIGYELEDRLYPLLPSVLEDDYKITIKGDLKRTYITYPDGNDDEVNIYCEAKRNGHHLFVIGESKAQIGKGDLRSFARMLKRVTAYLKGEVIPIFICYNVHPSVEKYAHSNYPEIKIYKSFEIRQSVQSKS